MSEQPVDSAADQPTSDLTEVSPEVVKRLEELGYVDAGLDI